MTLTKGPVAVIGAGPAGLTAAWRLADRGVPVVVFEQDSQVGGISRTVEHKGFRFDIGGHRFFTGVPAVQRLWRAMLGSELLTRDRTSRIYYDGRFFDYPLQAGSVMRTLGVVEATRIIASYLARQLAPVRLELSFEDWTRNRFGDRLYSMFFKSYTEKVWGMPCSRIGAQWAAQRIKGLSLWTAARSMVLPAASGARPKTLVESFEYPRLGPGMMWDAFAARIWALGGIVVVNAPVTELQHEQGRITQLTYQREGETRTVEPSAVISTTPLRQLVAMLHPRLPPRAGQAARCLKYRDFLTVGLMVRGRHLFPDQWIYVHDPGVRLGRIQNFANWSPDMVPHPDVTGLGLEYFCNEGDGLWSMDDDRIVAIGIRELAKLGLCSPERVIEGIVIRVPKASPVYDEGHAEAVATLRDALAGFTNLQVAGRNGLHKYNNQDHSMVTALLAAENVLDAGRRDVWSVNQDDEYHEEAGGLSASSLLLHLDDLEATQPHVPRTLPAPTTARDLRPKEA